MCVRCQYPALRYHAAVRRWPPSAFRRTSKVTWQVWVEATAIEPSSRSPPRRPNHLRVLQPRHPWPCRRVRAALRVRSARLVALDRHPSNRRGRGSRHATTRRRRQFGSGDHRRAAGGSTGLQRKPVPPSIVCHHAGTTPTVPRTPKRPQVQWDLGPSFRGTVRVAVGFRPSSGHSRRKAGTSIFVDCLACNGLRLSPRTLDSRWGRRVSLGCEFVNHAVVNILGCFPAMRG